MRWYCRLLGGLSLEQADRRIDRFRTEKTALLLGYLAYHLGEWRERIALADLLWNDSIDPDSSLRTALSSLRRQLEPAGTPTNSILQTASKRIRLNPDAIVTDVQEFLTWLQQAREATDAALRGRLLTDALQQYRGELLQGYEAEWLITPRAKLKQEYLHALGEAVPLLLQSGAIETAQRLAEHATTIYPLSTFAAQLLIRLYLSLNLPELAEAAYERYRRELGRTLGDYPRFTLEMLKHNLFPVSLQPLAVPVAVSAPPVRPRSAVPAPLTRCFGREQELQQTAAWLREGVRLITITGPPGIGKTRLGQELGLRLEPVYDGRVFWVSLREARNESEVRHAFALVFECETEQAGDEWLDVLAARIGDAPTLLITDNWEQVLDSATLLAALLQRLPRLQAVALSRHLLELAGARWLELAPLPLPEPDTPLETLVGNPSVALLIDRAQSMRPDFALTPTTAPQIVQLCRLLEGVPLAIELAAGQLSRYSLSQLLQHAHERLDWLQNRRRDVGYPYRSLQAALESSFAMLTLQQQRAFVQLAFLQDEVDEPLASAVLGEPAAPILDELTRCSLLQRRWHQERPLYSMLESIRMFGQRKGNDIKEPVLARLSNYFEQLGKQVRVEFNTEAQFPWLFRLRPLYPNLQQAMEWAVAHAPRRAARMLVDYGYFLDWEQRWEQGRVWCVRLLHSSALTRRQQAQLLSWLGLFLLRMEQYDPVETHLQESIRLCQAIRDWDELAGAYNMLGLLYTEKRRFAEADCAFARGVKAAYRHARPVILAPILHNWGLLHYHAGGYTQAIAHASKAHQLYEQIRAGLPLANTLNLLGCCYARLHQWQQAQEYYLQAAAHYQSAGYLPGVAMVYLNLAEIALERGELAEAIAFLEHAQEAYQHGGGSLHQRGNLLLLKARLAHLQGDHAQAKQLLQQCHEIAERVPRFRVQMEQAIHGRPLNDTDHEQP
ncbi:MAG: hypothetical protein CFK48_09290 [Armatimonadetes bacterium CP1_7O]|jgi:predicted ATPase/DNA-binding SARP family transcriptional activator/Flp pilus assembly protein TadD|nr:MAG: hypothetical protein CFK48_09290 [Armatimonadetes bacterium CP1_7O]